MPEPLPTQVAAARAEFVKRRKHDNFMSHHAPVSLAKDWTGRGFKDYVLNQHWQHFLEGWLAATK